MSESPPKVTAAILAGGLGSRLRSVVSDRPKVLAPVGGRPYLTYLLDQLENARIRDVVLLIGYRADQVRQTLGDMYRGMRLRYSEEETPLGTAGAVRQALPLIHEQLLLLMNGDSYCDVELAKFREFHSEKSAELSLVLRQVEDTARYGCVHLGPDGRAVRFEEKGSAGGSGWINAGVYLIDVDLVAALPQLKPLSLERDLFPRWVRERRVYGYRCNGRFIDIGTPESYAEAEGFFGEPGE